jgi:hypothetical protein
METKAAVGGGWCSGSTPHAFLQSSSDSYCATRAIHDTKVRDLQRKIDEEAAQSASLDTEVQSCWTAAKDLQSSLDAANSELNAAKSEHATAYQDTTEYAKSSQ